MASVTLTTSAFAQVSDGQSAKLVQFRGSVVQIAHSATPAPGDWIEVPDGEIMAFPAGAPVFARAANAAASALVRPYGASAGEILILGNPQVGGVLALSAVHLEGGGPDLTYRAQWLSVAAGNVQTPIIGAVGATYAVGYSDAGLGIRAMVETPTGEIIYSQIVNIPVTQPAPLDALAVTVTPHPTNPALIRIIYNGPLPPNGGSPITAVRRERVVGGVSQGVYHLRTGGALPVVGGVYDVPGETGVDNTVFVYAENATSGAPNKGTPHVVVPGSATQVPGAVTLLAVTPGDSQNTVTFAAPATGGAPVDYLVEVTTDDVTYATVTTILAAGPLSHVHTGLTNGIDYTYRVTPRNAGGSGAAATASGRPSAPAVAPTITAEASATAVDLGASIRYTFTNPTATGTDPIAIVLSTALLDGVDVSGAFSGLSIDVAKTALDQALAVTFLASNAAGSASSTVSLTVAAASALTVDITEAASDRFNLAPNGSGVATLPLAGTTSAADDADIEVKLIERFRRSTLVSLFASTRAAVLALKDDLTTNGVGNTPLAPVSTLAGKAGLLINSTAKTVTVQAGATVSVFGVSFDGWRITINAGAVLIPMFCLFGNPGNAAIGGNFFVVDMLSGSIAAGTPGARLDAYFCSFESSGTGTNRVPTLIKVRTNDNAVSVAPTTNLFNCRFGGYGSDSVKPVRGQIEFCYFDPAITSPGAHSDLVTVPACDPATGMQFRACYFNQDSAARGAGYTGFPAVADGVNNIIRLGPGTNGIAQTAFGQVLVSECVFERDPATSSKSFQFVELAGCSVTPPRFVNNKWIKDDASASRWYAGETTPIEWGNNLTPADATTSPPAAGTAVTAPAVTAPAAWPDLDVRTILDWTAAGVALSGAWSASLTFAALPFDVAVLARVAGSASVDAAAYTYRTSIGNTYSATITPLAASLIFYDTGKARGANAADIPVSGTTTAPDGATIEIRLVRSDTLAEVYPWQAAATASGGAWSGVYLTASRTHPRLKVEARVAGSTAAVARTAGEIKLGHIALLIGQSEEERMVSDGFDNPLQSTPTLIDATAEDSVFLMQWSEGPTQTFAANGIKAINPANRGVVPGVTRSMVQMADILTRNAPGENFLFIAAVKQGTSYAGLVDDGTDASDGRSWSQTLGDALTYIRQWAADVGVLMSTWTAAPSTIAGGYRVGHYPIFAGMFADGAGVYTYGQPTGYGYDADHGFWDLSGLNRPQAAFNAAVTKMAFHGPHRFEDNNPTTGGIWTNKQDCRNYIRAMVADPVLAPIMLPKGPEIITYQNGFGVASAGSSTYEPNPANWVDWADYSHPSQFSDDGAPMRARHTGVAILYAFGVGPAPAVRRDVPKFNRVYWDPDGSRVQLWYEDATGATPRLSTTRRERAEAAIPTTYPHRTEVAGFYRNNVPCTSVVIAPGVMTSGNSAVVQINADGDPFDYTDVIGYGLGGASGVVQWPQDEYDGIWKNLPIAITGIAGVPGIAVEPMPDPADVANTLPAPDVFAMSNASNSPRFTDTATIGTASALTLRWKGKMTSLAGETLFSMNGTMFSVKRRSSGASTTRKIEILVRDANAASIIANGNTGITLSDDQVVDMVVSFSLVTGNRVVKLFLDGAEVWSSALTGTAQNWSTNRYISVFQISSSDVPDGETEIVEIWKAYSSDGDTSALGAPHKRIEAGTGGTIVETPSSPAWLI